MLIAVRRWKRRPVLTRTTPITAARVNRVYYPDQNKEFTSSHCCEMRTHFTNPNFLMFVGRKVPAPVDFIPVKRVCKHALRPHLQDTIHFSRENTASNCNIDFH